MTTIDTVILVGYFLLVTLIGLLGATKSHTTADYFFAGRRFGWFPIAMSCVATVVGTYSFVKYSSVSFQYGFAASQNYLNDWMWIPIFLGAWLPILWAGGITTVPEYFARRFNGKVRLVITALLLIYMLGYIGINFRTLGKVLHTLHPLATDIWWSELGWACIVAVLCGIYVTAGGQVSVIATDLFQGALLLIAGFSIVALGVYALADHGGFWANFPAIYRAAFTPVSEPPNFAAAGLFWQDGFANSGALFLLNQGMILRFLSVRSQREGRKAITAVVLFLMPLAAIAVCGPGWIGRAMAEAGMLEAASDKDQIFLQVADFLLGPGFFGLVVAALAAALMSTADTLINATAAITVNDIWRPYIKKGQSDRYYLRVSRMSSVVAALVGIALVPLFMGFKNIFDAHGMFTAAITPPLVICLLFAIFWPRFSSRAAIATLIVGMAAILLSMFLPELIAPFAHGIEPGGEGPHAYKYMRAFYGIVICVFVGVFATLLSKKKDERDLTNLVMGQIQSESK